MYSKECLKKIITVDESKLSRDELAAKRSVESRGLPYYGKLKFEFPHHFSSFLNVQSRCKKFGLDLDADFTRDVNGLINFILYLGPIPVGISTPSVGRWNHEKGYVKGNFMWQDLSKNSSESAIRNKVGVNIENVPSVLKFRNLQTYIKQFSLGTKILITNQLVINLGYSRRKDLIRSLKENLNLTVSKECQTQNYIIEI